MTESNPNPEAAEAPRRRGILGFLFKTTLGCASFALGVLIVLILLLPTLLSGTAARMASSAFSELHHGRLEIASLDLAWFSTQTVRDARVVDPAGVEVARASITLPSLWSLSSFKSGHIGTIVVDVQADLVADDAGVTNLQRALAPRHAREETNESDSKSSDSSFDVGEFARKLDLDLRVNLQRVTWSDAETRRVGAPFQIHGGVVTATAKPGQPIALHVGGNIAGDAAGVLEIDAAIHGPIDMHKPWPLGRTVAKGRVERFSTAMVDGIAGLAGDLVEVLGPHFTLRFDATAESAERGELDFTLDGARAGVALHAQLADGRITSIEKPFLVASAPFPRKIIERIAGSKLPPDAKLVLTDVGRPWTARISRLNVLLPKSGATDLAALQPALADAEIVMDVELPGSIVLESDLLRAANISAGISEIRLEARAAPGRPLVARFEAQSDVGDPGRVRVDVTMPDAFALIAGGPIPKSDVKVLIDGVSTLALGELAGQGDRIARALGPKVRVEIDASQANLEGGGVRVLVKSEQLDVDLPLTIVNGVLQAGASGRIAFTPTPEFVAAEIGAHVPSGRIFAEGALEVVVDSLTAPLLDPATHEFVGTESVLASLASQISWRLPKLAWEPDPTSVDAATLPRRASFRDGRAEMKISGAGPQALIVSGAIDAGSASEDGARLRATADLPGSLASLVEGGIPQGSFDLDLQGVSTAILEGLGGVTGMLEPTLGPRLNVRVLATGALPDDGKFDVTVGGDFGRVKLRARLEKGLVLAQGEEGIDVNLRVTPEFLTAQLGGSLPAGTRIAVAGSDVGELTLRVHDVSAPLEATDLAQRLAATRIHIEANLPAISYADAKTDLVGKPAVLSGTKLTVSMTPDTKPVLRLESSIAGTEPGTLDVHVTALDPLSALAEDGAWKKYRTSSRVRIANVPTALVDALAGQDGLLVEALGPRIALDVDAPDMAYDRGAFQVNAAGGANRVALVGRLEDGVLLVDSANGLDADLALGPIVMDRLVGRLLPMLRKASFLAFNESELTSSAKLAPFLVDSSDVRFALDGDVSKLNAVFRIDLGTLSFQGLPMLEQLGVKLDAAEVRLPAFTVPIRDGVAYYDKLPIRIAGRDVLFDGNVRLTDGEMSLATSLPLALLGKSITRELDKVREFLPADTAVPVELRGTWNKPRLAFKDGFVSDMLKKAGENAVEKAAKDGLDGLLDGLLGGKKKKKDG